MAKKRKPEPKQMGRHPLPDGAGKVARQEIRMESAEKSGFLLASKISGMSLSGWMRDRLRKAAMEELRANQLEVPFMP